LTGWLLLRGGDVPVDISVYLLRGSEVLRIDATTGEAETLASIPGAASATLDPTNRRVSWITTAPESGAQPELSVQDLRDGRDYLVGPGSLGVWNADGTALAHVAGDYPDGFEIAIAHENQGFDPKVVLSGTSSVPVGWIDDRLILFDRYVGEAAFLPPRGEPETFATGIAGLWGVSPDGEWAIALDAAGTPIVIDVASGSRRALGLGGWTLLDGGWRPGTGEALAPLHRFTQVEGNPPMALMHNVPGEGRLVRIDPATASVTDVPVEGNAHGPVFWDRTGTVYAYVVSMPGPMRVCLMDGDCLEPVQVSQYEVPLGIV
jgi:hypothetical protein